VTNRPANDISRSIYTERMPRHVAVRFARQSIRVYARRILIVLIVSFVGAAVAPAQSLPAQSLRAEAAPRCLPTFPFQDGWWGADAAYSIPLSDGRSVWIFGDTLYGDHRVVTGNDPRMVRNTIGISRCSQPGNWQIQYVIRRGDDGQPHDFFQAEVLHPHASKTWYWALDGFVHEKDLWVTLLCVRNARVKRPDGFDFETCGTDLARVSDLDTDPQKWKVAYFPLVPDGAAAYPSATAVVDGDYAYLFALYEKDGRPMLLTRIPVAGLDAPRANLQFLSKDEKAAGKWAPGFKPKNALPVMPRGISEMTVRYHPDLQKWLAVMRSPDFSSDAILLRTAPAITGPWSAGEVIYHIPEMQKNSAAHDSSEYDKNVFCYAGKEHPEFEQSGSLLITYVCNTTKVPDLATKLKIYVPKVVEVPLPADVSAK
jgi:hypothetical protein